ncbi:MAG: S-layer homology domain-containing protein [Defluviitaleaceae bacterium]|nr:S-layer homology domain-containing protein [Defluviitaleaceae bacterium]
MQGRKYKRRLGAILLAVIMLIAPVAVYGIGENGEVDVEEEFIVGWSEVDMDEHEFSGSFLSLQLVCVYGNSALAIITTACESLFFATSANMTDWEIRSPAIDWYIYFEGSYYWYADGLYRTTDWREDWQFHPTPYDENYEWDGIMSYISEVNENIRQVPTLNLLEGSVTRIERLPYSINNEIIWVGFATQNDSVRQINLFIQNRWLNPLAEDAVTALVGIDGVRWAREAIEFMVARDLMDLRLCPDSSQPIVFDPMGRATRGSVLAAAIRALELTAPEMPYGEHTPFDDVPLWGRGEYIDTAKRLGLVAGIGNNQFAPDRSISRQDMMTMLYNILLALGQIEPDYSLRALGRFRDLGDIADYARLPIASLARAGIIAGDGININPRGYMTRVEAAAFVWNLYRVSR